MFGNKSGIAMMLESMIPPELMSQITTAAQTIPKHIEGLQNEAAGINNRLRAIEENQHTIIVMLQRIEQKLDPSVAAPETALSKLDMRVQENSFSDEDEELMRKIPVGEKPN